MFSTQADVETGGSWREGVKCKGTHPHLIQVGKGRCQPLVIGAILDICDTLGRGDAASDQEIANTSFRVDAESILSLLSHN